MVSLNLFCLGSAEFLEPKFISFTKFGELGVIFFPKHIFCTNLSSSSWTPNTQMSNLLRVHTPCGSIPFFKKIFFFSLLFRLDVSIFNSLTLYVVICILTLSQMLFFHICRHMHEKRLSLLLWMLFVCPSATGDEFPSGWSWRLGWRNWVAGTEK